MWLSSVRNKDAGNVAQWFNKSYNKSVKGYYIRHDTTIVLVLTFPDNSRYSRAGATRTLSYKGKFFRSGMLMLTVGRDIIGYSFKSVPSLAGTNEAAETSPSLLEYWAGKTNQGGTITFVVNRANDKTIIKQMTLDVIRLSKTIVFNMQPLRMLTEVNDGAFNFTGSMSGTAKIKGSFAGDSLLTGSINIITESSSISKSEVAKLTFTAEKSD